MATRGIVVENSGASFGLGKINSWLGIGVLIAGGWFLGQGSELILIGGLANLVDRFLFGHVRDYWRVPVLGVFNNINDWVIFLGAMWWGWKRWKK